MKNSNQSVQEARQVLIRMFRNSNTVVYTACTFLRWRGWATCFYVVYKGELRNISTLIAKVLDYPTKRTGLASKGADIDCILLELRKELFPRSWSRHTVEQRWILEGEDTQ